MLSIDSDVLLRLAPPMSGSRAHRQREIIDGMGSALAATLARYEIDTPTRAAHFLAQIAHESDGFCTTEEYASGQAYEHRADLGNTQPGDGRLFKGRGLIQLTGRANYRAIGQSLGLDLEGQPLSVNEPFVYLLVSCEYWKKRNINRLSDADDIRAVTRAVNGGLNGLDQRTNYYKKARTLIAGHVAQTVDHSGIGLGVVHLGSSGDAVSMLQHHLRAAGYPVSLDGEFGPATELAVKHFQAGHGLKSDGVVGAATWQALLGTAPAAAA